MLFFKPRKPVVTKAVFVKDLHGNWREYDARVTESGLFVEMFPSIRKGGHFLLDEGRVDGPYLVEWKPA